jgi:hypothetical protein
MILANGLRLQSCSRNQEKKGRLCEPAFKRDKQQITKAVIETADIVVNAANLKTAEKSHSSTIEFGGKRKRTNLSLVS